VEERTIWFLSIPLLLIICTGFTEVGVWFVVVDWIRTMTTNERLFVTAVVTTAFVILMLILLILPTIGGVEIGVETILSTIQLAPPIIGVFTDHLVARATTLGVVVVSRDADNILWIDLEDHRLASVAVPKVREIGNRAEVQSA